jgi:hypothetical protein
MGQRERLIKFYSILNNLERRLRGPRRLAHAPAGWIGPRGASTSFMSVARAGAIPGQVLKIVRVGAHALTHPPRSKLKVLFYVAVMLCGVFCRAWEQLKMKEQPENITHRSCCSHVAWRFSQGLAVIENKGKFLGGLAA